MSNPCVKHSCELCDDGWILDVSGSARRCPNLEFEIQNAQESHPETPDCTQCNATGIVVVNKEKWLCACKIDWRVDPFSMHWSEVQRFNSYLVPVDRQGWYYNSLDNYERYFHKTENEVRLWLAEEVKVGRMEVEWITNRLFLAKKIKRDETIQEAELRALYEECPLAVTPWIDGNCRWCGKPDANQRISTYINFCTYEHAFAYNRNHKWTQARTAALRRDKRKCVRCDLPAQSVNHIVPILGKHNIPGCHHHQDNLESVCDEHHRLATNEQRRAGYFK